MTELQLSYLRDQEQARANRANEALKAGSLAVDKAKAAASIALDEARRKGEDAKTAVSEAQERTEIVKAQQAEEAYGGLTAVWNNDNLTNWQKIVRSFDVLHNNKALQDGIERADKQVNQLKNDLMSLILGGRGKR